MLKDAVEYGRGERVQIYLFIHLGSLCSTFLYEAKPDTTVSASDDDALALEAAGLVDMIDVEVAFVVVCLCLCKSRRLGGIGGFISSPAGRCGRGALKQLPGPPLNTLPTPLRRFGGFDKKCYSASLAQGGRNGQFQLRSNGGRSSKES